MSVSSIYREQLRSGGGFIEGMDIVADAIWHAPNKETGLAGPYFFAMYGERPDQPRVADVHASINTIEAPVDEPLLILKPDHKFEPAIVSKPEGANTNTGVAYTIDRDGRRHDTGRWVGMVGIHAYRFNRAGTIVAGVQPLIHAWRPVGTANTKTDLTPSKYSFHVGQVAIESAIFDAIAQIEHPTRSAEKVLELFNSRATLLRNTLRPMRRSTIKHT
ncbi:MAG: hypothetical protein WBP26_02920 [Candidatus Saccharimonadales bacterium]